VCLSVREHISRTTHAIFTNFCACCLSPWLGLPPAPWRNSKGKEQFGGFSKPPNGPLSNLNNRRFALRAMLPVKNRLSCQSGTTRHLTLKLGDCYCCSSAFASIQRAWLLITLMARWCRPNVRGQVQYWNAIEAVCCQQHVGNCACDASVWPYIRYRKSPNKRRVSNKRRGFWSIVRINAGGVYSGIYGNWNISRVKHYRTRNWTRRYLLYLIEKTAWTLCVVEPIGYVSSVECIHRRIS